ncbi:Hsp20 family protein, partial [Pedobacter sp. B4-66]
MSTLTPWIGRQNVFDPFSMDLFDPFSVGTSSLLSDFGRRRTDRSDDTTAITQTNVDWAETPESHIFHADIPGVRKNEVKVQVEDGNILHISGERMKQEETDT